jgi:putative transposase
LGDTLKKRRRYRTPNILDEGDREALTIEIGMSLPSVRVVQVLKQLVAMHELPAKPWCANSREFVEQALVRRQDPMA